MVSSVPKGPKRRGFSLVELMNFLALAALLATLGMYGLARYVRHAKTAEAVGNVSAIAQAAASFYNESDAHQPAGTKPEQAKAMRHFPTGARQTVPADPAAVKGKKYQSTLGDWSTSPWLDLQFKITQPQCYAYNFESAGSGATATATVTANGDLDANGVSSTYRLTVTPDDKLEATASTNVDRIDPDE
jgi:type IV pilus assembly protein PilA